MANVTVNGEKRSGRSGRKNWGELLDSLERPDHGGDRRVTAVRFDGVDVPTFRDETVLARDLAEIGVVDVDISTLHELLHDSAQAAYESVAPLQRALGRITRQVRAADPGAQRSQSAHGGDLSEFMTALRTLTALTAMLANESKSDRSDEFHALIDDLCRSIDSVIERQGQRDWRGVADILDMQLAPALAQWSVILGGVREDLRVSAGRPESGRVASPDSATNSRSTGSWTA